MNLRWKKDDRWRTVTEWFEQPTETITETESEHGRSRSVATGSRSQAYQRLERDGQEDWSREEKVSHLAARFLSVKTGECYINLPDKTYRYEVPFVQRYLPNPDTVLRFMQDLTKSYLPLHEAEIILKEKERAFLERSKGFERGPRPPQKRNRRIYILKGDAEIYALVAKYQFVTAEMAAMDLKRDPSTVRKRFLALYESGYLNRSQRDKLAPFVYFLGEHGAYEAARLGYIPEVRFIKSKSRLIINHDLEITMFHRELEKQFAGHVEKWEQWRGDLKDEVETEQGTASLIPDARFQVGDQSFFLEVVKSYESEYEDGESNIFRKVALYNVYKNQFRRKYGLDDFRVLWVLPTKQRVLGFAREARRQIPVPAFLCNGRRELQDELQRKDLVDAEGFQGEDVLTVEQLIKVLP